MKIPFSLFAVVSLGLSGLAVYLYQQSEAERERAEVEMARAQALQDEVAMLRGGYSTSNVPGEVATVSSVTRVVSAGQQSGSPSSPRGQAGCTVEGARQLLEDESKVAEANDYQRMLAEFKNPELHRKHIDAYVEGDFRPLYLDLIQEQRLSPQQANAMLEVLAEQRLKAMTMSGSFRDEVVEKTEEGLQTETDASMVSLLGDKYEYYRKYRQSLRERQAVLAFSRTFEAHGAGALQPDQRKRMLAVFVEEKFVESSWGSDTVKRTLARMKPILSAAQYKQIEQEWARRDQ